MSVVGKVVTTTLCDVVVVVVVVVTIEVYDDDDDDDDDPVVLLDGNYYYDRCLRCTLSTTRLHAFTMRDNHNNVVCIISLHRPTHMQSVEAIASYIGPLSWEI
jgi:hypothetical protein